jgi:hypothetical protein
MGPPCRNEIAMIWLLSSAQIALPVISLSSVPGTTTSRRLDVMLVPASAPYFFIEDAPTAILARQVPGATAQFEEATAFPKLR